MVRTAFLLLLACTLQTLSAQNIKGQDVAYRYIQLPLNPLPPSVRHYRPSVIAAYEAENRKKQARYEADLAQAEADFQRDKQEYPALVKAAEDQYNAEMAEWEKKSRAEKVIEKQILKENNKPVKRIPNAPYKRDVPPPALQTTYDYPAVASTHLVLDGYENHPDNAVLVEVTLYGFEYTPPQQMTEYRNMVSVVNGTSTTRQVPYYHNEFTYRHNMSVKATLPDGKELFFLSPQELNTYKTHKSPEFTMAGTLYEPQLVKPVEEKTFRENLAYINDLVNDRIGFKMTPRKGELSFVKAKDDSYSDLTAAFNEAASGLKLLIDDEAAAKTKLQGAVQTWNTALAESDPNNKKARIDKDVIVMIHFNLLETCFALRDVAGGEKSLSALNMLSLSNSERKRKDTYESLFNDLKKRLAANNR